MSKKIYFSIQGTPHGGGPSVFVWKMATALKRKGHHIVYNKQPDMDVALMIISAGNIINKVKGKKTKVLLRLNGIYNKEYNKKFNRAIRPDMTALHDDLRRNIPLMHHTIYQSKWSRDRIWDEIIKVDKNYSIIHNGADTNIFKSIKRPNDGFVNLIHVGKMRDAYLMEMLIGTYRELRRRGQNVKLILVGSMDGGCKKVLAKNRDNNIVYIQNIPNNQVVKAYNIGDIFLGIRQGCSSNNTTSEAQACGLGIIVPEWGGDHELVTNGQTGIIVPSGHWDYDQNYINGIADAVEKMIPDLEGYKKRAREHAVKNLSLDIMVNKYLKAMGV